MSKSYEEVVHGLRAGPRFKNEASRDLESLARELLDPNNSAKCFFNSLDELEVFIGGRFYNLTMILENNPDFEHLSLSNKEIEQYEDFILNEASAEMVPEFLDKEKPTAEDFNRRDPTGIHAHLLYAEKLAINVYTGDSYSDINDFLRQAGQLHKLKKFSEKELALKVKEIVLTSCIAAHGLTRVTPEAKNPAVAPRIGKGVKTATELLYRTEEPTKEEINAQRKKDMENEDPSLMLGFSSTSATEELVTALEEEIDKGEVKRGTIIKYLQAIALNPLGRDVELLSKYKKEKEKLFAPGTQFKFYEHKKKKLKAKTGRSAELTKFKAVPVRTIDVVSSYSSRDAQIRSEVLDFCRRFDSFEKLNAIGLDELQLFKEFIEEEIKDKTIFKNVLGILDDLILTKELLVKYRHLIPHIKYVYEHHLSKAYRHKSEDPVYDEGDEIVYRPNHGLAHSLRVALFLDMVIDYFAKYAEDKNFRKFCQEISDEQLQQMQLAMLFSVSGRESEVGFRDDLALYSKYKEASYKNFRDYVLSHEDTTHMSKGDVSFFKKILLGEADYFGGIGEDKTDDQYIFNIMTVAHNLDLLRCKDYDADEIDTLAYTDDLVDRSSTQKEALDDLFRFATATILAHGDRLFTMFDERKKGLASKYVDYDPERFVSASTDPHESLWMYVDAAVQLNPLELIPSESNRTIDELDLPIFLHFAIKYGHITLIKALLERDPNLKTIVNGRSAIHLAALEGREDILELLLAKDKDLLKFQDSKGRTPLFLAFKAGHTHLIDLLIDKASIDAKDPYDKTILSYAVQYENYDVAEKLIEAGAKIQIEDLMLAIGKDDEDMVKLLLSHANFSFSDIKKLDLDDLEFITDLYSGAQKYYAMPTIQNNLALIYRQSANLIFEYESYSLNVIKNLSIAARLGSERAFRSLIEACEENPNKQNTEYLVRTKLFILRSQLRDIIQGTATTHSTNKFFSQKISPKITKSEVDVLLNVIALLKELSIYSDKPIDRKAESIHVDACEIIEKAKNKIKSKEVIELLDAYKEDESLIAQTKFKH